ncbi:MAG: DUF1127 domain-containing protein, partial [Dongiaceae bacterium]
PSGLGQPPAGAVAQAAGAPFRLLSNIGSAIVFCLTEPISIVLIWLDRYRQRRTLHGLSDHMLKDMGVSRADVEREVSKQFWRK